MALIATVQLMDDLNTSVSKRYEMEATTLAQAAIDIGVLAADLLAVTDLGIVSKEKTHIGCGSGTFL